MPANDLRATRLWRWLLFLCAIASAVPLWASPHLPFTDLPEHVAAIASLRHFFDPAWHIRDNYTLEFSRNQYLLYYLLGALLAVPLRSAEVANLVLLTLTCVALPYGVRSLLRALSRDERLALLSVPLFWSQPLLIGFFNYLSAMPVLLWALALCVRHAQAPTRARKLKLAIAAVALYWLHLSALLFFVPAALGICWLWPPPAKSGPVGPELRARLAGLPAQLLWLSPALLLAALWAAVGPVSRAGADWTRDLSPRFEAPATSLRHLPEALTDIWWGLGDDFVLLGLAAVALLLAWPRVRPPDLEPRAQRHTAWASGLLAGLCVLAATLYFAVPNEVGWLWQLNERYAVVLALLAVGLLTPRPGKLTSAALGAAAALGLASAAYAGQQIRAFEQEVGPFESVLAKATPGRRLLCLVYGNGSGVAKFAPFLHFGSYYRARGGGIASFSFSELPHAPLQYRASVRPPKKPMRWEWNPSTFDPEVDGSYYDYVLVRGQIDPFWSGKGPAFRLVAREGAWALYVKEQRPGEAR